MEKTQKTLEYYRRLPYTLQLEPMHDSDDSNYWTAEYTELRGCKTDGQTDIEAVANLQELFDEYISVLIEDKIEIPEPTPRIILTVEPLWYVVKEQVKDTQKTGMATEPEIAIPHNELVAA